MATRRRSPRSRRFVQYTALTVAAIVVLLPIYVTVAFSLQTGASALDFPSSLFPFPPELSVFRRVFSVGNLGRYMLNSAIVAVAITVAQVLTSILAGYAFAFLRFPARNVVFVGFLATLMVPSEVTIVANYDTIVGFDWLDSYQGLVAPFMATAFGTFLVRQAFLAVPQDLRDASRLDGYGHWGFMWGVAVPLARPAIAALGVFSFLLAWNQYLWPLLITNTDDRRTVQIGLKTLASNNVNEFNLVFAGTVVASIPIFILLLVFQKQLVRGLTSGAVKG
ncbi:MAG: carbohydrate ABC transporter permease [Acidimicrobiia bacterium]|nr:carbohydrate ABC transporter permease [Acidimicrobiia bacterium]